MCALHGEGWYWGEGALGSQRSSPRQPQPECGQAKYSQTWPLRLLPYRLEAEMGFLGWTRGEDFSLPTPPTPQRLQTGLHVWGTQVRELKGLGPGEGRGPPRKAPPSWPLGIGQDFPELCLGGGTGGSVQRDPDLSTCSTWARRHRRPWGTATASLRPLGGSGHPSPENLR